jgi:hypothetical protein
MLSFHGDPKIKAFYVARFAAHRAADEVVQGNGRGCFVGCTLDSYDHDRFPIELGWPEWLAHLADEIFEAAPKAEAPSFGTDILDAVPVGVNLEPVRTQFLLALQERNMSRLDGDNSAYANVCRNALAHVIELLRGGTMHSAEAVTREAWAAAHTASQFSSWSDHPQPNTTPVNKADIALRVARSATAAAEAIWSLSHVAKSARSNERTMAEAARAPARAAHEAERAADTISVQAGRDEYATQRRELLDFLRKCEKM